MGNCALKPKVLLDAGAPAPEELKDSLLEDQKIDAAKSLSNLFLQARHCKHNDMTEKKMKEDEKITPENMPVAEDLKTALADDKSPPKEIISPAMEIKYPVTETISPTKETISSVVETKAPADDHKIVTDVETVKESETKAKAADVGRETDTIKET